MDTVVSALDHQDKYILEKKYQSLADALAEARRIDPTFVAINHRINNSPYMLTITDCLLWRGEETYIDVHISNRTARLYNRDCSIGRELTSEFFKTPFRQFEDHGICFNSCLEKWEDDLVAQAFGRASVLSPEMYGTFFFLGDEDYPRLARLIQLHKRLEPLLKTAFPLPGGDIAHADGASSLLVLRNMTWEPAVKTIPLDGIDRPRRRPRRAADRPAASSRRVPHDEARGPGRRSRWRVELDPFSLQTHPDRHGAPGRAVRRRASPTRSSPGPDAGIFDIKLLGGRGRRPMCRSSISGSRSVRTAGPDPFRPGTSPGRIAFPGAAAGRRRPSPGWPISGTIPPGRGRGPGWRSWPSSRIDDDALEIREMDPAEARAPSTLPEIEACRAYMWDKVVAAEGTSRNAFDGEPGTRWSDGFPRRSPFTGSPAAYRSETSLWRIDLGRPTDLATLELRVVRRTDDGLPRGRRDVSPT